MTSLSHNEPNGYFSSNNLDILRPINSASSSITSTTLFNHPILRSSSSNEQVHRQDALYWQKEFEQKNREWQSLQIHHQNQLNQLEIHSGQINEENKRLKIALDHEKQRAKIEQNSIEQKLKALESEGREKLQQMKISIENEKREHARIYQELLHETNQRLKKMEHDHKCQQAQNQSIIDDMEKRFEDLRTKISYLQQLNDKSHEDKLHLIKQNEQLQLQVQELTNKQHHSEHDHRQRLEHDHKSLRVRYDSLRKEHESLKTKSSRIIDDLEKKFSLMTEQVEQMQKLFQEKLNSQQKKLQYFEKESQENQRLKQLYEQAKHTQETNKKKLVEEYEQFIEKLEHEFSQKILDYEKRMETLITKTHEQWKGIEDDLELRNSKQSAIITDQQKVIDNFKEEQMRLKSLQEQTLREKNQIKEQFDVYMKNLEKNFQTLSTKKEQLERKITYLIEEHKHQLFECRLSYEDSLKGLLANDVRVDFETTIHSLKQQIIFLQQRIAFLQQELDQYIQIYGHRPTSSV